MRSVKKIICLLLVVCLIITSFPNTAVAALSTGTGGDGIDYSPQPKLTETLSGYCGGDGDGSNLSWTLTTDGTLTISGTGPMADFVEVGKQAPWYAYREVMTSLVLQNGITYIGANAFWHYSGFSGSLNIPDSVLAIGEHAFYGCSGFSGDLTIPDSVLGIDSYAFAGCSGFDGTLTLSSNLMILGSAAFLDCSGLTGSLIIPDSLTSIEPYTFYDCSGFDGSLTIGDNVVRIGSNAFLCCRNLKGTLDLPGGLKYIEEGAFSYCETLSGSLKVPDSVERIGASAFSMCFELDGNLILGNGLISIGDKAFQCCSFTGKLTIPYNVTSIGENAFAKNQFYGRLIIPDGVTYIGDSAFAENWFEGELVLPKDIISIGINPFSWCFESIAISAENPYYSSQDGVLYNKDQSTLIAYPARRSGQFSFPDTVTQIGADAFSNSELTGKLKLPSSLVSIGDRAFTVCSGLDSSVVIPESVETIGSGAFYECAITDYYFVGNAPQVASTSDYEPSFYHLSDPLVLYYVKGKPGWASPIWNGYNTALWDSDPLHASVVGLSPENDANTVDYVDNASNQYQLFFDTPVLVTEGHPALDFEAGSIRFYRAADNLCIYEVSENPFLPGTSDDVNCVYNDEAALSITPSIPKTLFTPNTEYYIEIDEGVIRFKDQSRCPAIGKEDWSFKTKGTTELSLFSLYPEHLNASDAMTYIDTPRQALTKIVQENTDRDYWGAATTWSVKKACSIKEFLFTLAKTNLEESLINDAEAAVVERLIADASQMSGYEQAQSLLDDIANVIDYSSVGIDQTADAWKMLYGDNESLFKTAFENLTETEFAARAQAFTVRAEEIGIYGLLGDIVSATDKSIAIAQIYLMVLSLEQMDLGMVNSLINSLEKTRYSHDDSLQQLYALRVKLNNLNVDEFILRYVAEDYIVTLADMFLDLLFGSALSFSSFYAKTIEFLASLHETTIVSFDEIMQTDLAMCYVHMFYYTLIDLQEEYGSNGMNSDEIASYKTMFQMYLSAIHSSCDLVEDTVLEQHRDILEQIQNFVADKDACWEHYIELCLKSANSQAPVSYTFQSEIADGKAHITGAVFQEKRQVWSFPSEEIRTLPETIVIPSTINGFPVTSIANSAFENVSGFKRVIIPETVRRIGERSFAGCRDLEFVSLANGLTEIGSNAFNACTALSSLVIPQTVNTIGKRAFYDCTQLDTIILECHDVTLGDQLLSSAESVSIVSLSGSSGETYATSQGIDFVESKKTVLSLSIVQEPDQASCLLGNNFNSAGAILSAQYSDGSTEEISSGWITVCDSTEIGESNAVFIIEKSTVQIPVTIELNPHAVQLFIEETASSAEVPAVITISNRLYANVTGMLYYAAYDQYGKMLAINCTNVSLAENETKRLDAVLYCDSDRIDKVKTFFLSADNKYIPIGSIASQT